MKNSATTRHRAAIFGRWLSRAGGAMAVMGILALAGQAQAATPVQFSQQGRLLTASGEAVEGSVEMTFRLYDAPSGGAMVWEQVSQVTAKNGFYNATLGSIDNPLNAAVLRDGHLWLAMAVEGGEEMSPRQELNAVPYAVVAARAESVADGAVTAASIAPGAIADSSISSVGWAKLRDVPAGLDDGDDDTLGGMSCASGETVLFDGSNWTCGARADTDQLDERYASHDSAGWFFEAESTPAASSSLGTNAADPSASAGTVRAARASDSPAGSGVAGRMWGFQASEFGAQIAHGPTLVTVRAKVINASSTAALARLKCAAERNGAWADLDTTPIIPAQFGGNATWREFVLFCDFAPDDTDQRISVDDFEPAVTDLYIDYARTTPRSSAASVTSEQIVDGTIQGVDIKNGTLTGAHIATAGIGSANIADQSVTSQHIAPGSINASHIQNNSIRASQLGQIDIVPFNCAWTPWINNYDQPVFFYCPVGGVVRGVESVHDNGPEDRRFRYYCCSLHLR